MFAAIFFCWSKFSENCALLWENDLILSKHDEHGGMEFFHAVSVFLKKRGTKTDFIVESG